MMVDQQAIVGGHRKKEKKEKKKKIKAKRDMREFYEATKTKVTLELDPFEKRARGQSTFIFKIKPEEEINSLLGQMKAEDLYKKIYLELRFHSK
jgi:Cu/Ag efflux protein CusF